MRLGALSSHSHLAGMSALWHDIEYIPDKRIDVPTVERGLEEEPLPSEKHLLPEGLDDPFEKHEKFYDVAMEQRERGLKAQAFFNGKPRPADLARNAVNALTDTSGVVDAQRPDPALQNPIAVAEQRTKTMVRPDLGVDPHAPASVAQMDDRRAEERNLENRKNASSQGPETTKTSSSGSATDQRLLEIAEGLGVGIAAMSAAQAIDPASVVGTAAAEAMSAVKAAGMAKMAVGMSRDIADTPDAVNDARRRQAAARAERRRLELEGELDDTDS